MPKHNFVDMSGQRFGKWTVLSVQGSSTAGDVMWNCRCDCGEEAVVRGTSMRQGRSACCRKCRLKRHGLSRTPTHNSWLHMIARCLNKNHNRYERYGGRGISVCERWLESFDNFLADMGECPNGHSIDRIDLDGNYEPTNCRWATSRQQARNRSRNRVLTFNGQSRCLAEWGEITGLGWATIAARIRRGKSIEESLTTPKRVKK